MKVDWNKKYTTIAIYAFLVIASSIIVYLMASQAEDLKLKLSGMIATMQPFIIGAAIAYIINFILNFYEKVIFELKYINKSIVIIIELIIAICFSILSLEINSKLILYILFKYCTSIKLFFFFLLLFLK